MLALVFDICLGSSYPFDKTPASDFINEFLESTPAGDVHARITLLILLERVKTVAKKVLEDLNIALKSIQVKQRRARFGHLLLKLARIIIHAFFAELIDLIVASVNCILKGSHHLL